MNSFLDTMTLDPDCDYNMAFAKELLAAGVPVEHHLWSGASHSSSAILCDGTPICMQPINDTLFNNYHMCTHFDLRRGI